MRFHIDLRLILSTLLALVITCVLMVAPAPAQGTGYSISLNTSTVQPGGTVLVSWSKPNGALSGFFSIYRANNFVNQVSFAFPAAGNSGTATIFAPNEPGGYWVVWEAAGIFQTKAFFQVILSDTAGSVPGYSLSISPNPVNAGANVTINWTKPSGTSTGLIVLYDSFLNSPGRGVFTYLDSVTPIGDTSGSTSFTVPSLPGGYWFGWISTSDFELKAVVPFSVALNEADSTAPVVSISTPANNAAVSGTAQAVSASASDNIGVAGVQFRLDGVNLGAERTTAPYSIVWDTTNFNNGSHSLTAVARDAAGNLTTSTTIAVTVGNTTTAPASPSKSSPGNGSTGQHHVPKLQWGTASGAISYEYCVDTSNNSVCDASWISVGTKTSVFVGGLNSDTTYFWQVRAVNSAVPTEANGGVWWSFKTSPIHVNVAAAVNGAIATASSTFGAGYSPAATINGDRKGLNFGNGGVWTDGTPGGFPDWVEVDFAGPQTIDEVDVFTAQDNLSNPVEPTLGMTFTQNGITDYEVQYWNGLYWARTFVGDFNGNNQVWRQISFEPITTRKIRVFISGALNNVSRITEIEAYSDVPDVPGPLAKSAPANGATGRSFNPTLIWSDSRSALSYEYCVDTINNNACDTGWINTAGTTSVVVSGLNLGTKYYWQVRARNTAGTFEADGATWWNFTTSVSYVNVAAAVNGAIAIASSTLDTGYGAAGVINGDRKGLNWGNGGGWNDGTERLYPDWVEVDFAGPQTLSEIYVFTLQDDYPNPSEPVLGMPFNLYGITDFQVQSWDGQAWVTVPNGNITGNNLVWRQISFNPFTTTKIRVLVTGALNSFSRITEIEAYSDLNSAPGALTKTGPGNNLTGQARFTSLSWTASRGATSYEFCIDTVNNNTCDINWQSLSGVNILLTGLTSGTTYYWQVRARNGIGVVEADNGAWWTFSTAFTHLNVAAAINGGTAIASSVLDAGYSPAGTINGDRKGLNWGSGGGWNDASGSSFPDWLEVDFNGAQTIDDIDVFTLQDNFANPVEPTMSTTFSQYGITAFQVQYWDGQNWVNIPGGNITGNNLIWRQIGFGNITTTKIRVFVTAGLNGFSRITEIEAYSDVDIFPGAFSKTSPANNATKQARFTMLNWTVSTASTTYEYCLDTINNNSCDTTWQGTANTSVLLSGLSPGTTYYWQVRARNGAGVEQADNNAWWTFSTGFTHLNVAAALNGATASASTTLGAGFAPSGTINGDRKGLNWGNGGGWNDASEQFFPDWLQVDFAGPQTIDEIDVFTLQDNLNNPGEPTMDLQFSQYGITAFQAQYWNGSAWAAIPGGTITGNNLVWRQIGFANITTDKIRINVTGALAGYSRITEVEAYSDVDIQPGNLSKSSPTNSAGGQARYPSLFWTASTGATSYEICIDTVNNNTCDINWVSTSSTSIPLISLTPGVTYFWQVRARNGAGLTDADGGAWWSFTVSTIHVNVAAAANGSTAIASSTLETGYAPAGTINGDRKGLNWGNGGGWNDGSGNSFPDWLEVDFPGPQTIDEVNVFTLQDNFTTPIEPTPATTFTLYGVTSFQVQYWDGASWVVVPGGSITGNNLVWRQIFFGTVTTTKIRIFVTDGLASFSRITEVEAYSDVVSIPGPIAKSSPSNGSAGQAHVPTLSWSSSAGATSYEFCVDTTPNSACDTSWLSAGAATAAVVSGLNSQTTYYWQVRARNGAGVVDADGGAWWSFTTGNTYNIAAAIYGAIATASSTRHEGFAPFGAINGDRRGLNWGNGGGWADGTEGVYPDWLQVEFLGPQTINEIDVFTSQDNAVNPAEPTPDMTFTLSGITSFEVQYWDGQIWVRVPGGNIDGNRLVWRKLAFSNITTTKIRVLVVGALGPLSRITELEAYSDQLNVVPGTIVVSGGFENGSLAPWSASGTANVSLSGAVSRTGNFSLAESGGSGGLYQDFIGLTPGALYQVMAFAHANPGTANQARLELHDTTGANGVVDGWRVPSSGWDPFTTTFTATATGKMRISLLSSGGAGTIFWDDVSVVDLSGFENSQATPWPQFGGVNVSISKNVSRTGQASLAENGSSSGGVFLDVPGLTPGTLYQVTAFAHADPGASSQALLLVHDTTGAGSVVDGFRTPSGVWEPFTVTFMASSTGKMRILLFSSGGTGSIYWDDIQIVDASGFENAATPPWPQFGGVSASIANSGGRTGSASLAETGISFGGVFQELVGLTPGALYQVTAYARADLGASSQAILLVNDGTGANSVSDGGRSPGTGWNLFSVTFVATASGHMRIHLISSGGTGTLYWDDVHVVDASGFENGVITPWSQLGGVSVTPSNAGARSGITSLAQTGGNSGGLYQEISGLTPGELYQVTAFAYADPGTANRAMIQVHDTTGVGTVTDGWRTPSTPWEPFTVTFMATANGRMGISLLSSGAAGSIFWDDLRVNDVSGFENVSAPPWPQFGGVTNSISKAVARTGLASLAQNGGSAGGVFLDLPGLTPGSIYQITAFAHSDPGATSQALLLVHDTTGAASVVDGFRTPGSGWSAFTVMFMATSTGRMRILLFSSGGSGAIYWDDVHIVDASGFENATTSPWPQFGGVNVSITNTGGRTGSSSLAETGSTFGGVFQDFSGLIPGALYQVVAFAHAEPGTTSQAMLLVHDATGVGSINDGFRTPGGGWDPFTVTFVATASGQMRIHLISSGGNGAIFWDDIHVVDASSFENGILPPWSAFSGVTATPSNNGARSGTTSLAQTGGNSGGIFQEISGLIPGELYQVTAFAYADPGTANQALILVHDTTGGGAVSDGWRTPGTWDPFTVTFMATSTGRMRIHLFSSGASGTIFWDDVRVVDVSGFENVSSPPWPQFGGVSNSISKTVARTGLASLEQHGTSPGGVFLDLPGLTPGAIYQIIGFAHSDPGATNRALLLVHDTNGANSVVDGWRTPGSGWSAFSVTFAATATGRMRILLFSEGGTGSIYWDDVHIVDAGGFENITTPPWPQFGGVSLSIANGVAHSGSSSLAETGNSSGGAFQDFTGLTPGVTYQVKAFAHSDPGGSSQAMLLVHDTTGANSVADGFRIPAGNGWDVFSVQFVATATGSIRIHLISSGGTGKIYWDDINLK